MKKIFKIILIGILAIGCSAGNTEQTRTTVSDYNVFEGRDNTTQSNQESNSSGDSLSNTSEASVIGSWKLVSSSGGYPHAIGSSLMITNNTFALTQPNASGSYTISGSVFSFDFGGGLVIRFNYQLSGNTLTFYGIDYDMSMVYSSGQ